RRRRTRRPGTSAARPPSARRCAPRSGGSSSPPRGPARSWAAAGTRRWRRDRTTAEAARRSLVLLRLRLGEVLPVDRERDERDAHLVGRLLAPPDGPGRVGGVVRV